MPILRLNLKLLSFSLGVILTLCSCTNKTQVNKDASDSKRTAQPDSSIETPNDLKQETSEMDKPLKESSDPSYIDQLLSKELQEIRKLRKKCRAFYATDPFPKSDHRNDWCHIKFLTLPFFYSFFEVPVFLDGPHKEKLNFESPQSFAFYNKEFINKLNTYIKSIDQSSKTFELLNELYTKYFKHLFRTQYIVGNTLQSQSKWLDNEKKFYNQIIENQAPIEGRLVFYENLLHPKYFAIEEKAKLKVSPSIERDFPGQRVAIATGFWVRRAIKDQFDLLWSLHATVIEKFDTSFKNKSEVLLKNERLRLAEAEKKRKDLLRAKLKNSNLPEGAFIKNLESLPMSDDEQL